MLEKYVKTNLAFELQEIQTSFRSNELLILNDYEKAIIYRYTDEGYESVNEKLRNSGGQNLDEFGRYLNKSLKKLPNFRLICYRAINLSSDQIKKYKEAFDKNIFITEHSFVSCSISRNTAMTFHPYNVLFFIHSKTGKVIENIAKFGKNSNQNEREVLFTANTKFKVIDVKTFFDSEVNENKLLITLEE